MRTLLMRLSLRFVIPLAAVIAMIAFVVMPLADNLTVHWFVRDIDVRSQLLANALHEPLLDYVSHHNGRRVMQLFDRTVRDERLFALAFCDPPGKALYKTVGYPDALGCRDALPTGSELRQSTVSLPQGQVRVTENALDLDGQYVGKLVLVHGMGFIEQRSADTRKYVIGLFALLAVATSLIAVLVAHLSWRGWIKIVKSIVRSDLRRKPHEGTPPELRPLVSDLRTLLHEADMERRIQGSSPQMWTPEKLRALLREELSGDEVLVVSNREPYLHVHTPHGIEVRRPASGLVTAVEPVMRACSGTWIAHGAGSADRETVDRNDRVQVPPSRPGYTLRRVWLSKEEVSDKCRI